MVKNLLKIEFVKFLNGGVAMQLVAFSSNFLLADYFLLDKNIVYAYVMIQDFLIGFFVNRFYVFENINNKSNKKVFGQFLLAGLLFRALNWIIYVNIIQKLQLYILAAQLLSTTFVLLIKFSVYKKIFK